jgi:hypothetical protein
MEAYTAHAQDGHALTRAHPRLSLNNVIGAGHSVGNNGCLLKTDLLSDLKHVGLGNYTKLLMRTVPLKTNPHQVGTDIGPPGQAEFAGFTVDVDMSGYSIP